MFTSSLVHVLVMFWSCFAHLLLIFCSFERAVEAFASGKVAVGKVAVGKVTVGKVAVGKVTVGKVTVGKVTVGKVTVGKSQTPRFYRNCNVKIGRRPPASKIAARAARSALDLYIYQAIIF